MKRLKDRVAVVTGAGSGIGKATSIELARRGCHLALVDMNEEAANKTALEIERLGRRASVHQADVSKSARMKSLAKEIAAEHGRINIVVNNAGVGVGGAFEDSTLEDWKWVMDVNVWGVVHGCMYFLPYLKEADEAHIVNISSAAGFAGIPGMSAYCATKFAVLGLSESLRVELAEYGIGVTSIHPGAIKTNILNTTRYGRETGRTSTMEQFGEGFMERFGRPPAVAAKKIVDAIAHNDTRIRIGAESYLIDILKRYAPIRSEAFLSFFERRLSNQA